MQGVLVVGALCGSVEVYDCVTDYVIVCDWWPGPGLCGFVALWLCGWLWVTVGLRGCVVV